MRRTAPAAALAAILALGTFAAPADGADIPFTLSAIDASTPGHVQGTVTTEAPFVLVQTIRPTGGAPTDTQGISADPDGGTEFDALTWGLPEQSVLSVRTCTDTFASDCGTPTTVTFTPTNLAPTVTWSDVDKVSPNNPPYVLTVSDPGGTGSTLEARYRGGVEQIQRNGETTLRFPGQDGTGSVEIWRCGPNHYDCVSTGRTSPSVTVRRSVPIDIQLSTYGPLRPHDDATPDATLTVFTAEPGDYTLDWWVDGTPSVGVSGIAVSFDESGRHELDIDLSGAAGGTTYVRARLTHDVDGFGTLTGISPRDSGRIRIDTAAPWGAVQVSSARLYPKPDGYKDTVDVDLGVSGERVGFKLEILNRTGAVVRTYREQQSLGTFTWNGRVSGGGLAPAGAYTFRATLTDDLGNSAVYKGGRVTVSLKRLVTRTFTRTVTAAGSRQTTYAGKCSVVRRPSLRHWAGSLGLYSNTKCEKGFKASLVETHHAVTVPNAFDYGQLRITMTGGASKAAPRSYLFLDQLNRSGKWGSDDSRFLPKMGTHKAKVRNGARYVQVDRGVVWAVYTAMSAGYDIGKFTVTLKYRVLR